MCGSCTHAQNAGPGETTHPSTFIVNVDQDAKVSWVKLSAQASGEFTVTNSRNGKTKTYAARP